MLRSLQTLGFVLLISVISFTSVSFDTKANTDTIENPRNNSGKKKKNSPSPASRRALSSQPKRIQNSIKRNEKRNRKNLKHRAKKQKRQKHYSRTKTFR